MPTRRSYDVTVIGLGAMGSAIAAACAARGVSVLGLEQFQRGHALGSSNGKSRMIRKAYFEDPAYVPLLLRAYDLWRELECKTKSNLLEIPGLLMVGKESAEIISGSRRTALQHNLRIELLDQREMRKRYPTLVLQKDELGLFEPEGGMLAPERVVEAQLQLAEASGAHLLFESKVTNWIPNESSFEVTLEDGTTIRTSRLVLALGPWFQKAMASAGVPLRVQRNLQAWFRPTTNSYQAGNFPEFLLEREGLPAPLYGFPDFGDGVKAAFHGLGESTTPELCDRNVDPEREIAPLRAAMELWMPGAAAELIESKVCMYSITPDGHFIVDRHPAQPNLFLCGGFSGHGFKFAPVIGEIISQLALDGGSEHEIEFLSLRRFAQEKKSSPK